MVRTRTIKMKRLAIYILVIIAIVSCKKEPQKDAVKNYLIEFGEFEKIASDENVKIIDFRKPELYKKDHIEGAMNLWRPDIRSKAYPYKGMMASKEEMESLFSSLGIKKGDLIVAYDDKGLCDAARLWWVLQIYGYDNMKMLHGSYTTWKMNHPTTAKVSQIMPSSFTFQKGKVSHENYISKDDVLGSLNKRMIVDTRTADEYSGKRQKKGAQKGGRIPGALRIDWANAVNYHGDMKFKSIPELKEIYKSVLSQEGDTIIAYCQSGTRSAHTTFVLTQLLGMKNVKNYDGSWIEWSYFNDLPFEKDSITTIFE